MSRPIPIRLGPADADRYRRLRLHMLRDAPWAFDASPETDAALDSERLAQLLADEHQVIFAIEAPPAAGAVPAREELAGEAPELVAAASITRSTAAKFWHRARIWGVFVEPEYRGRGYAQAVLSAALELARSWRGVDFVDLGVSASSADAQRLYENFGFAEWGREPEATELDGRRYDEIHMTLRL